MVDSTVLSRLLSRGRWDKLLAYTLIGSLLVVAIVLTGEDIAQHIDAIESEVMNFGPWGVVAFIGAYILATSVMMPESVLSMMAGALFGLVWGFVAVAIGGFAAAALQYALAHRLLRKKIDHIVAGNIRLSALQRAIGRNELKLQFLIRLTPLNPATVSYVLGASGIRFGGFLFACLAMTPHLLIEVYVGFASKHVARLAGSTTQSASLRDSIVFGGLAVTVIVVVLLSRRAHRALMQALAATATVPKTGR